MAGQPGDAGTEAGHAPVTTEQLEQQLAGFKSALHAAIVDHDGTISAAATVAKLQQQLANQQALVLLDDKNLDGWAKACRVAVDLGNLAVKLAKSTLNDRVSALEAAVTDSKRKGKTIAAEAKRRRKTANAS